MKKLDPFSSSAFKIWKSQLAIYNEEHLEEMLSNFCKISGARYLMVDHFRQKIISTATSTAFILGGYSKETIDEHGLDFRSVIYEPDELLRVNEFEDAAYLLISSTPVEYRTAWVITYESTVKRIDGGRTVLNNKLTPYKLDDRGNPWITLWSILASGSEKQGNPTIMNKETNEYYEFVDGRLVKKEPVELSADERLILEMIIKGYTGEHISERLGISESTLRRKKFLLYKKVNVKSMAELVHWAHLNAVI